MAEGGIVILSSDESDNSNDANTAKTTPTAFSESIPEDIIVLSSDDECTTPAPTQLFGLLNLSEAGPSNRAKRVASNKPAGRGCLRPNARVLREGSDFLRGFDPENSKRERKKHVKKFSDLVAKGHDKDGVIKGTGMDLCDCLEQNCPGCFFPSCMTCKSYKCSFECRRNRKWIIESIVNENDGAVTSNPVLEALTLLRRDQE